MRLILQGELNIDNVHYLINLELQMNLNDNLNSLIYLK